MASPSHPINAVPTLDEIQKEGDSWKEEMEPGNGTRRRLDGELRAMSNILGILDDLAPAAQRRVLVWLADRCQSERQVRMILEDDGAP